MTQYTQNKSITPNCDCGFTGGCLKCNPVRDRFIGMLEPGEAEKMKEKVALFKKRFDDDLARRNKIL